MSEFMGLILGQYEAKQGVRVVAVLTLLLT